MLEYVEAHGHKKSLDRDGYSIMHIYRLFGEHLPIHSMTVGQVCQYQLQRQAEGAAPATINREIGFLSAALNWAKNKKGWKVENPAKGHRLKEAYPRTRWLTREESEQLLEAATQEPHAAHLPDFILLALYTGMRSGEILGLEWRRVDLQQSRILLEAVDQKNGKPGMVPLNSIARTAILARARYRAQYCPASRWVFCNRGGHRITSVKKSFSSAVLRAGIDHCTPHDLRRTFGSWLVQSGIPIQKVAKLLRHSDIRITDQIYAHLQPEQLHDAAEVICGHSHSIGHSVGRGDRI
jgi:integrase